MIALYDADNDPFEPMPLMTALDFAYEQAEDVSRAMLGDLDISASFGERIAERAVGEGADPWDIGAWPLVRRAVAEGRISVADLAEEYAAAMIAAAAEIAASRAEIRRAMI